jgi:hypothetical protein
MEQFFIIIKKSCNRFQILYKEVDYSTRIVNLLNKFITIFQSMMESLMV